MAELRHYANGPSSVSNVKPSVPTAKIRLRCGGRPRRAGTLCQRPVALEPSKIPTSGRIAKYVKQNLNKAIEEASWGTTFHAVMKPRCVSRPQRVLKMASLIWTATRLLMKGWQNPAAAEIMTPGTPFTGT